MKKLVFAVRGASNQGKTTTIKYVCNRFLSSGASISDLIENIPQNLSTPLMEVKGDIRIILKYRGKLIGIESTGDPVERMHESIRIFRKHKCDIILCGCRTRGSTVESVKSLGDKYDIIFLSNYVSIGDSPIDNLNCHSANQIFCTINDFIELNLP